MKPGNKIHIPALNEEWEEIDKMMLFACFTLLEKYVKEEAHLNDWEDSEKQKKVKDEIDVLSHWWNYRKKLEEGLVEETKLQEQEDTEMLIRLIQIRCELWS